MEDLNVVTGASSGVGRALARELAGRGLNVLAIARRQAELEVLRDEHPTNITILSADLGDPAAWQHVADFIRDRHRVRTLTHSAAIATKGSLEDLSLDEYRALMGINVEAPLFLTQALLPCFTQGARILHLSSGAAHRAIAHNGLYCISKAALLMAWKAWNADFPGREILVGSARPGVVDGPMQDAARSGDYPGVEVYRGFKERGLLLRPARVAEFLAWLLLSTGDEEFIAEDWHVNDETHHGRWLKGSLTG